MYEPIDIAQKFRDGFWLQLEPDQSYTLQNKTRSIVTDAIHRVASIVEIVEIGDAIDAALAELWYSGQGWPVNDESLDTFSRCAQCAFVQACADRDIPID